MIDFSALLIIYETTVNCLATDCRKTQLLVCQFQRINFNQQTIKKQDSKNLAVGNTCKTSASFFEGAEMCDE